MSWHEALLLLRQGQPAAARAALLSHPEASARHAFMLGACEHALGNLPAAIEHFSTALACDPAHAQAACALGSIYGAQGRYLDAEALFRNSLERVEDRQLRFNLAVVLDALDRPQDAEAEYDRLLAADPDDYPARHNRAALRSEQMRLQEAAADYRELRQRHPEQTLPWQNLADLELGFGHYAVVLELIAEVRRREPGNAKALLTEALALAAQGEFARSEMAFAGIEALDPGLWQEALARVNGEYSAARQIEPRLIYLLRQHEHRESCDWSGYRRSLEVWRELDRVKDGDLMPLAFRALNTPLSATDQRRLAQRIAVQGTAAVQPYSHQPPMMPKSRLKVGYCSPNFGQRATGLLVRKLLTCHDPATVEVCLLSLAPSDDGPIARELRSSGLAVHELAGLDDAGAAAQVKALELDVLVSLVGYNTGARPRLLAARPAPVQVSWLAMPSTTGAGYMDYFLSDAATSPGPGWCSEAEVWLPQSYFVFSHEGQPPQPPDRHSVGLPPDGFVFCCLNASYKHEPDTFALWMDLLHACPGSLLWLLADSAAAVLNLRREAEWQGIDPQRLRFAPRTTPERHLARLGVADLFLDTRYVNGHTTVAEALWSGLPVLTCPGETFASRVAHGLVTCCGLNELSVGSWTAYRELAEALYHDRERLGGLRRRLAQNRLTAAPFQLQQQARALEAAYRRMHERFCAGLPPEGFVLDSSAYAGLVA